MATTPITALSFEWDQLNDLLDQSFHEAVADPSKRWIAIANSPSVGSAILLAHTIRKTGYCSEVFVGHSVAGIAVWIDILSWAIEEEM